MSINRAMDKQTVLYLYNLYNEILFNNKKGCTTDTHNNRINLLNFLQSERSFADYMLYDSRIGKAHLKWKTKTKQYNDHLVGRNEQGRVMRELSRVTVTFYPSGQETFSVKGRIANISGFLGSASNTQFCHCKWMAWLCYHKTLFTKQELECSLLIPALYFKSGLGYTDVCTCQNSSNWPWKICAFHYMSISS